MDRQDNIKRRLGACAMTIGLLTACQPKPAKLPEGWIRMTVGDCCSIGLPKSAVIARRADAIDEAIYSINGLAFEATLTLSQNIAGPPIATSAPVFATKELKFGRSRAFDTSYIAEGRQARHIVWVLPEKGNKEVQSLVFDATCDAYQCTVIDRIVPTFVVES
jgi:hypothetical protein